MVSRVNEVVEAFKRLSEYDRALAFVEIERLWLAPYEGPEPWTENDDDRTSVSAPDSN